MAAAKKVTRARHAEVLEVAGRLFYTKGYEATSIQDIADEMGMLKGSLYYYISTKEDVLFEIIRSYHEETRAYFDEIVSSDLPPVERLRKFIETETAYTAHHVEKSSLFFTEWRSLTEERRKTIVVERDRHDQFVRSCIKEAQSSGAFRPDADARLVANGLLGMVNSVYQWYDPSGPSTAEEIGAAYAELVINGLKAQPAE
jgi:AcrR family transcriptional regulator